MTARARFHAARAVRRLLGSRTPSGASQGRPAASAGRQRAGGAPARHGRRRKLRSLHSRTSSAGPTTAFTRPVRRGPGRARARTPQHVHRPAEIQPLSGPRRRRRTWPDRDPRRRQPRVHRRQRRARPARWFRNFRQRPSVRPREADRARGVERHPQSAFVRRPMMPPAELHQVVEPGRPTVRPVPNVVCIAPPGRAAREAAASISRGERAAQRRRDRACLPADVQHLSGGAVGHDDPPGVARQPLRRFRGDAQPAGVLQDGLTARGASSVAGT